MIQNDDELRAAKVRSADMRAAVAKLHADTIKNLRESRTIRESGRVIPEEALEQAARDMTAEVRRELAGLDDQIGFYEARARLDASVKLGVLAGADPRDPDDKIAITYGDALALAKGLEQLTCPIRIIEALPAVESMHRLAGVLADLPELRVRVTNPADVTTSAPMLRRIAELVARDLEERAANPGVTTQTTRELRRLVIETAARHPTAEGTSAFLAEWNTEHRDAPVTRLDVTPAGLLATSEIAVLVALRSAVRSDSIDAERLRRAAHEIGDVAGVALALACPVCRDPATSALSAEQHMLAFHTLPRTADEALADFFRALPSTDPDAQRGPVERALQELDDAIARSALEDGDDLVALTEASDALDVVIRDRLREVSVFAIAWRDAVRDHARYDWEAFPALSEALVTLAAVGKRREAIDAVLAAWLKFIKASAEQRVSFLRSVTSSEGQARTETSGRTREEELALLERVVGVSSENLSNVRNGEKVVITLDDRREVELHHVSGQEALDALVRGPARTPTCGHRHEGLDVVCSLDEGHDPPHCPIHTGPRCPCVPAAERGPIVGPATEAFIKGERG